MKNEKNDEMILWVIKLTRIFRDSTRSTTYKGTGFELENEPFSQIEMSCLLGAHAPANNIYVLKLYKSYSLSKINF